MLATSLHSSIPQSPGQWTRAVSRGKKVRFHYSLCDATAVVDRFRASSEMIKHYDRFIGGHDSTVNHRRKRATREATRDPLTTWCHSRTLDRLDAAIAFGVEASFFFPTFLRERRYSRGLISRVLTLSASPVIARRSVSDRQRGDP